MKYNCKECNKDFNADDNKIRSSLVKAMFLICPNCGGSDTGLSANGKLMIERKNKIRKIEFESDNNI